MNASILLLLCVLSALSLWLYNNQSPTGVRFAFAASNRGRGRTPRYDLVMRAEGVKPRDIPRLKGHTVVLNAKPVDLDKWTITTEKGSIVRGDMKKPVKTGMWRIPVFSGSTFKQITVPLVKSLVPVMEAALRLHPSIAWLKDDKLVLHYQDGLRFPDFCEKYGMVVSGPVGKRDKRISRWLRPQALFGYFDESLMRVLYETRGLVNSVAEDGVAATINRTLLINMAEYRIESDKLTPKQEKAIRAMARYARRVELTYISGDGQYKGDAIVCDGVDYDILLVKASAKPELRTMPGRDVFISAQVRHTSQMRLDVQTHLNWNANKTFSVERLATWMTEYVNNNLWLFDSDKSMEIIDGLADSTHWAADAESLLKYPPYQFVMARGDPKWFAHTTRAILKSGLKGITRKGMTDLSFLVPGGNYHVMAAGVGRRAGLNIHVARGYAKLDTENATIWVNNLDAVTLDQRFQTVDEMEVFCHGDKAEFDAICKATPGLFSYWSGADSDDDIKCLPVHFDGKDKVICGRSPNEIGQQVVLNLTDDTDYPMWCGGQSVAWGLDLNTLPEQVAQGQRPNLGLVGDPIKGLDTYDHRDILNAAIKMINSSGAVGLQALRAWFEVAMFGVLPATMPAEISEIIDAVVKLFADLSEVVAANKERFIELAKQSVLPGGKPIPTCRSETFHKLVGDEPFAINTTWVDEYYIATHQVLEDYDTQIELRAQAARPPLELYQAGMKVSDPGRQFKTAWNMYWHDTLLGTVVEALEGDALIASWFDQPDKEAEEIEDAAMEHNFDGARDACLNFIERFHPSLQPMIMVGGLAHTYAQALSALQPDMPDDNFVIRDGAFWQLGPKMEDGGRATGFADITLAGLREIGLIGEVRYDDKTNRILCYDATRETRKLTMLRLNRVWFHVAQVRGLTTATTPGGVKDRAIIERAKQMVREMKLDKMIIKTGYIPVTNARRTDMYPCVAGPQGNVIGTLRRDTNMDYISEQLVVVGNSTEDDDTYVVCREVK